MKELTDENFDAEVLKAPQPAIVDFWAVWCGPCKMIAPIFEEMAGKYGDRMKFCKYDVDAHQAKAQEYGIRGIPALFVFKGGQVVDRIIGYTPKADLENRIRTAIAG